LSFGRNIDTCNIIAQQSSGTSWTS